MSNHSPAPAWEYAPTRDDPDGGLSNLLKPLNINYETMAPPTVTLSILGKMLVPKLVKDRSDTHPLAAHPRD